MKMNTKQMVPCLAVLLGIVPIYSYETIVDTWTYPDYCWRVDGDGTQIQPGDEIVLAECDETDDRQIFDLNMLGYDEDVEFVEFYPKLNKSLVIGVNKLAPRKRLFVQKPKADNSTQVFYFDEHGTMGMGTDIGCQLEIWFSDGQELIDDGYGDCLYVTHQGTNLSAGKIVHLKALRELVNMEIDNYHTEWLYKYLVEDWF